MYAENFLSLFFQVGSFLNFHRDKNERNTEDTGYNKNTKVGHVNWVAVNKADAANKKKSKNVN